MPQALDKKRFGGRKAAAPPAFGILWALGAEPISSCVADQHLHRDPLPGPGRDGGHVERQGVPGDPRTPLGGGQQVPSGDRQPPPRPSAELGRVPGEIQPAACRQEL